MRTHIDGYGLFTFIAHTHVDPEWRYKAQIEKTRRLACAPKRHVKTKECRGETAHAKRGAVP